MEKEIEREIKTKRKELAAIEWKRHKIEREKQKYEKNKIKKENTYTIKHKIKRTLLNNSNNLNEDYLVEELRDKNSTRRVNRKERKKGMKFDNFLTNERINEVKRANNKKSKDINMKTKDTLEENCIRVV